MNEDRSKFIGGSDAAAVLGISPWRTPLDLYLDKTAPRVETAEEQDNRTAKLRGKRLEPYIVDMLREEHGLQIVARNTRYVDPELPFLAAEIDAETHDGCNVEIKTVHPFKAKEWGEIDTDAIPVHYTAQAMHGLMVTGRDLTVFGVLIGDELRIYRVERDPETIAFLRQREIDFWNRNVLARVPPVPTTARDALKLFERDTGEQIEATPEIVTAVAKLKALKAAAAQIEEIEDQIKAFMSGAAVLTCDGRAIATWKTQNRGMRLDQKALTEAHPEIVEQFKRLETCRVFRLK